MYHTPAACVLLRINGAEKSIIWHSSNTVSVTAADAAHPSAGVTITLTVIDGESPEVNIILFVPPPEVTVPSDNVHTYVAPIPASGTEAA